MRLSRLRALLLALAMVFQTVAAGGGVARAAMVDSGIGVAAHCLNAQASDDKRSGDSRPAAAHHLCGACCLSAWSPFVATAPDVPAFSLPRSHAAAGFSLTNDVGAPARVAQARFARGPPA